MSYDADEFRAGLSRVLALSAEMANECRKIMTAMEYVIVIQTKARAARAAAIAGGCWDQALYESLAAEAQIDEMIGDEIARFQREAN